MPGTESFGKAFENFIFHELSTYNSYSDKFSEISYWRLSTSTEVDFIIDDMAVAIEAKASSSVNQKHYKGLVELAKDYPEVGRRIIVCLEAIKRETKHGIEIYPWKTFCEELWAGNIFYKKWIPPLAGKLPHKKLQNKCFLEVN